MIRPTLRMALMASPPSDSLQTVIHQVFQWLQAGQGDQAVAVIEPFIKQYPGHPQLHYLLGLAFEQTGALPQAIHHVSRAIALDAGQADMYHALAIMLRKSGKRAAAMERLKDAIARNPRHADLHFMMGDLAMDQGNMALAIDCFSMAIDCNPELLSAWINLGLCQKGVGAMQRARGCFEQALKIDGQSAVSHVNLAHTLLLQGDYERGFAELEWRFLLPEGHGLHLPPPPTLPRWNGEPLTDKALLVLAEQGYGDALQFVRFIPRLLTLGAEVTVCVAKPLEALFQGQPNLGRVQALLDYQQKFDYFIPMMSLGTMFVRSADSIVASQRYLLADPERSRYWRHRLPQDRFKVGLVWEGKALHQNDPLRRRSANLGEFASLNRLAERITLVSLQKEAAREQIFHQDCPVNVLDVGPDLHDFAETAAVVDNLDLVITIDTAVAHLAGGMGKPVWILLPFAPDWRWTLDRERSPWYPSSRLYRQTRANQWEEPIARLVADLEEQL
ncbi:MAG: tetratricopeptide repeat protein [Magnetococcales bacterium]|nr:tetratricopeptide repeat protein [Magnetococcales bacterium]